MNAFPHVRLRRLRRTPTIRRMLQENRLRVEDLIYPMFIIAGENLERPIEAMPGQSQLSVDLAVEKAKEVEALGIPAIILFGLPKQKHPKAQESYDDNGIVQQAIRAIKAATENLLVITDVCLCSYTDHGHCGPLESLGKEVIIANDETLGVLQKVAISHAKAGADIVAPSGMMDGVISALRHALDQSGFCHISIMAYAVKYASSHYGPFREAADSLPQHGDRKSYQMNPANSEEALREAALDVEEGADFLMVKPALAFLDIILLVKQNFNLPLVCYNVSGEYSMIKAAAEKGWIDEKQAMLEQLTAMKRAGADLIITYFAPNVAKYLSS